MVMCKVCGKTYKTITVSHLRTHNMTLDEYYKLYNKEAYIERKLIDFLMNYVEISNKYKFLTYPKNGVSAITVKPGSRNSSRKYPLGKGDLKNHLRAKWTVGIYPVDDKLTRLIAFDIDINTKKKDGDILDCTEVLTLINEKLYQFGITSEYVLNSYSGSKGYHIDLLLDESIDVDIALKFQKVVRAEVLRDMSNLNVNIEFRGTNGQAYKIPLGYHQKTNNRCFICNEYGIEENDLICLKKKKVSISVIEDIVNINYHENFRFKEQTRELVHGVKILDMHDAKNEQRRKKIEEVLERDITSEIFEYEFKGRNDLMYSVALYFKYVLRWPRENAYSMLKNWVNRRWDKSLVDQECRKHIKTTIDSAYSNDNYYFDNSNKLFNITEEHMKEVISIDVNHKQKNMALRKLYFILIIHSNYFADKNGEFDMSYSTMEKMGAIKNNRSALKKQLETLQELGKITIVSSKKVRSNYVKDKVYETNVYKVNENVKGREYSGDKKMKHCRGEYNCKDCMLICSSTLLERRYTTKFITLKEHKICKDNCPYNKKNVV